MPPGVARPAVKGKTPRARCHVKTLYGALRANFARDSVPLVVGPRPRGRADDALSPPERTLDAADARARARGPFHVRARGAPFPATSRPLRGPVLAELAMWRINH